MQLDRTKADFFTSSILAAEILRYDTCMYLLLNTWAETFHEV